MEPHGKTKKVLFVITKSNFGGAQHYVYDLATNLPEGGFEVVVALGGNGSLANKLREAGIHTISLSSLRRNINPLFDLTSFFSLLRIIRAEHPDIVHLNSAKASGLGALAARIAKVPRIIFTAHGWAFNEDRSKPVRTIIKFLSWLTVLLAHETIAVSRSVHRDTETWPLIQGRVTTVHNGIAPIDFLSRDDARARLLAQLGLKPSPDTFFVGSIAELHRNKGLAYVVTALAVLARTNPHISFIVLGDGEQKNLLNALVEGHKLRGRVFFPGFVEDAARYLKAFDCFVLPSVKEGFPYAILEAGLAGLPVIASKVGGIPEIIDQNKTGILTEPRDSEAIAQALRTLAADPAKCAELGSALEKKVSHDFAHKVMVRQTIAVYNAKK